MSKLTKWLVVIGSVVLTTAIALFILSRIRGVRDVLGLAPAAPVGTVASALKQ